MFETSSQTAAPGETIRSDPRTPKSSPLPTLSVDLRGPAARLAEAEPLLTAAAPDPEQRERLERLLAEARFGLEQSLAQFAENAPAREALARVEAVLEQRRRRAHALEVEAQDRDPRPGGGLRSLGLATMAVLASVAQHFARDAFIFAASTGTIAIAYFHCAVVPAAAFALSGVLCSLYPQHAVVYFSCSSLLAIALAALVSWRESLRARAEP